MIGFGGRSLALFEWLHQFPKHGHVVSR